MYKSLKLHHAAVFSLLLLFVLVSGRPVTDTDVWWHLKAGQYIWQNAQIPKTDPFSFTNYGHPWITHEWLSEIIYYLFYKAGKLYGLIIANTVFLSAVFTILYRLTRLRTGRPFMSAVLVMITAVLSSVFWVYRPHILGYICFLAFLYVLELYKMGHHRLLWILPPIMVLWVNLHGSYIMGLILIVLYLLAGFIKKSTGRIMPEPWPQRRAAELAGCLGVSILAVFINPNTYKMVIYPFFTVGNSNIVDRINEWASPNFHEPIFLVFLVVFLAGFGLLAVHDGRHRVSDLLLVAGFTGLACFAVRNIALYLLACTPVFGYYLTGLIRSGQEGKQFYAANWALVVAVILALIIIWPKPNDLLVLDDKSVFPAGAVKYLSENNLSGNILNDYNWGGYLLWSRFPQNRVFIDGRTDIYADRVYPDYLKIMNLSPESLKLLAGYNPDLILIKPKASLNTLLSGRREWQVLYRDNVSILYQHSH